MGRRPDVRQSDLDAVDRRRPTRSYFRSNPYEVAASLAAVIVSILYFVAPTFVAETTIGKNLGELSYVWAVLYGVGGSVTLYGMIGARLDRSPYEIAGLSLFTGAIMVNATVVVLESGARGLVAIGLYLAIAAANLVRIHGLYIIARRLTP